MWFTNLQIYRLTKPFTLTSDELEQRLTADRFQPCGALQPASYGWVPPLGRHGEQLTHAVNGQIMVCARKEEKVLPPAVIREMVSERAAEMEAQQGRPIRRKERDELRDEITFELLPKAFARSTLTFAYLSPRDNLLVVNASSAKRAEELVSQLRKSIGTLPVQVPAMNSAPAAIMTQWLSGDGLPGDIAIQDECELRDPGEEGGIIRCKRHDLFVDEIQSHLVAGKQVVKLAINWNEHISCLISDDLAIKRLRFADEILEQSDDRGAEDAVTAFDNDFSVMSLELARFIPRLLEVLGGENEAAYGGEV